MNEKHIIIDVLVKFQNIDHKEKSLMFLEKIHVYAYVYVYIYFMFKIKRITGIHISNSHSEG